MRVKTTNQWLKWLGACTAASGVALAGVTELNFNGADPSASGIYTEPGGAAAEWRANGGASGAAGDGYLSITDARGGQTGCLVFRDLENGLVVSAFKFEVDLRIGGGTAQPADGFSINYVAADDPVTVNGRSFSGTDNEPAGNPGGLPEEGCQTGLGIGFDTWQSATINGVQDVVGISVRVDGRLLAQFPVPLRPGNVFLPGMPNPGAQGSQYEYNEAPYRNLASTDANYALSMQTGARNSTDDMNGDGVVDANDPGTAQPPFADNPDFWALWVKNLKWERFVAELTEAGKVVLTWKGVELTPPGGLATDFTPRPGRIVLAGRTGGAWEVHHVDNIKLTTVGFTGVLPGAPVGTPIGFRFSVVESGGATVDNASVTATLNGTTVPVTFINKVGASSNFEYRDVTKPLALGATNTVVLTAKASGAGTTPVSKTYTFVTPAYTTLPATAAVTGVDTTKPGFNIRLHQVEAGTENTIARAEQQLAGLRGANLADSSAFVGGVYTETDTINYNQDAPGNAGVFNGGGVDNFAREDRAIPGIPGSATNPTDNIAAEITTYIQFPEAGVYTLIFNSDDGFRTYLSEGDVLGSLIVSQADVGRGATDSPVTLYVPTAGFYPFRTVWFEGGGGANLEWNAVNNSGVRALLNDSLVPGSLKTYRSRTGTLPPAVTFTSPVRGTGNPYLATEPIIVEISGGTPSAVTMTLDGTAVTPTVSGNRLTYTSPTLLAAGNHTVGIAFGTYTNSLTFTTAAYSTIPVTMRLKDADVDKTKPGFLIKVHQQANGNGAGNNVAPRERQIAGFLGYPNVADPNVGPVVGANGYRVIEDVINYNQDAPGNAGNFNGNTGFEDKPIPGIPGTTSSTDNIAAEILTVVEFPTAGLWILGFNSDDGFATYVGDVRDEVQLRVGVFDGGRGASDTLYGINIQQPGLYPVRTLWFEGGGGANFEWFVWNPATRTRILLNDSSTTGALKTYQYPLGRAGAAYVKSIMPKGGSQHVPVGRDIKVVVAAGSQTLDPATARMTLSVAGGAAVEVQPRATLANGELTISYTPKAGELPLNAGNPANNNVTARVWYGDRAFNTSFATTRNADADSGKSRATFFIEAEDFNFGGGQSDPAASNMSTYRGGAYSGRSATAGVDYQRGNEGSSPLYRIDENPQVPMDPTGDIDRNVSTLLINYKMGWIGSGQWYNYTRTFPDGKYNVYVGASHGDGPSNATALVGSLQRVTAGATTANQTLEDIGSYSAPGTGGWGNNNVVPVRNAQGGLAEVTLNGAQTIRWTPSNGDIDFLLFAPAVASQLISYTVNAQGKLVLSFPAGSVLTSSATLSGTYQPVAGASSPYTVEATADAQYYKLQ